MKGRVLIIAGSDSGGGAGIQADIKTVTMLGGYAATAVTAVTVQDTQKVHAVHDIPPDIISQQIKVVLDDVGADCIKIGMVGHADAGRAIVSTLKAYTDIPIVLDPVLVATSGDSLAKGDMAPFLFAHMVPLAHVVTPNLPELAALTGCSVNDAAGIESAARKLLACGADQVLAKGGHGAGAQITDYLVTERRLQSFSAKKISTMNTHGTGCTLASALAAGLAQGLATRDAVEEALAFVRAAIKGAPGLGAGHGPLGHASVHLG